MPFGLVRRGGPAHCRLTGTDRHRLDLGMAALARLWWLPPVLLATVSAALDLRADDPIDLPLFHTQHFPSSFYPRSSRPGHMMIEESIGAAALAELERRGHRIEKAPAWTVGRLTAAERSADGLLRAAATPRLMQAYAAGR